MIRIAKIVSGGQTGADQAGLRAARTAGLDTGGWAPDGWRTLDGPMPGLAAFGLREYGAAGYAARTEANVRDSDATVRFAKDFSSPGEICTLRAIRKYRRPHLDVPARDLADPATIEYFVQWLDQTGAAILNVAGNSEACARGIGRAVEEFLVAALTEARRR